MKKNTDWQKELAALAPKLGELGLLTHGTVQDRGHWTGGPVYQWTRNEGGKTVSVVLSQAQYEAMKAASEYWKAAKAILREMETVSRRHIFGTIPGVRRPKPLSKYLGLI